MKTVKIRIAADGNIEKYETAGYTGNQCREVQEIMLGVGNVSCDMPTAEAARPASLPAYNELHRSGN